MIDTVGLCKKGNPIKIKVNHVREFIKINKIKTKTLYGFATFRGRAREQTPSQLLRPWKKILHPLLPPARQLELSLGF